MNLEEFSMEGRVSSWVTDGSDQSLPWKTENAILRHSTDGKTETADDANAGWLSPPSKRSNGALWDDRHGSSPVSQDEPPLSRPSTVSDAKSITRGPMDFVVTPSPIRFQEAEHLLSSSWTVAWPPGDLFFAGNNYSRKGEERRCIRNYQAVCGTNVVNSVHVQPSQYVQPQPTSVWHGRSRGNLMRECSISVGYSMISSVFSRMNSR